MLYNGHLAIADTFSMNRPNHGQTLIEKPLYSGHFYSGLCYSEHFFGAPRELFGQNLRLNGGHSMIGWEKKTHACFYLVHFFFYFNMKLII